MSSISAQLGPLVERLRERHAAIRPISQVTVRLRPIENKDRFAATVDQVLRWMSNRAGRPLPDAAWQRQSFELSDIGAQRVAAAALTTPRYWAARLDDADKEVALRTWVTEVGVGCEENGDVLFGVRLICATRGADAPFDRTVPGFVRPIIAAPNVELDGISLSVQPVVLNSKADASRLLRLLESSTRRSEVIVFTASPDPQTNEAVQNLVSHVHTALLGVAHVFMLTSGAAYALTNLVGKQLSVFDGGVRTYRPGFNAATAEPSAHPLALWRRIREWGGSNGPAEFEGWIINSSLASTIRSSDREEILPSFVTVRQIASQQEHVRLKESGASDAELLQMFDEDNQRLRRELEDQRASYDSLLKIAETERDLAQQEAASSRALASDRLVALRSLQKRTTAPAAAPITIPSTLDVFEEWCAKHLAGSVELVNRAFTGVKKSNFGDPPLIYKALLLLKEHYVPMRTEGSAEKHKKYEEALQSLGLDESPTGEAIKYSADLYSVHYGGQRRPLDRHLKGKNSRDARFGFRLYFFWDDEEQVVVVGWLPSHLDNRLS